MNLVTCLVSAGGLADKIRIAKGFRYDAHTYSFDGVLVSSDMVREINQTRVNTPEHPKVEVRPTIFEFPSPKSAKENRRSTKKHRRAERANAGIKSYQSPKKKKHSHKSFDFHAPIQAAIKTPNMNDLGRPRLYRIAAGTKALIKGTLGEWTRTNVKTEQTVWGRPATNQYHIFYFDGLTLAISSSDVRVTKKVERKNLVPSNLRPSTAKYGQNTPSAPLKIPEANKKEWYNGIYLKSDLWKTIRSRVFARDNGICLLCGQRAEVVHHRSYSQAVLLGKRDNQLASLCHPCHHDLHFDARGTKLKLSDVDSVFVKYSQLRATAKGPLPSK